MPTNQFFTGSTVSNTLPATDRGWDEAVYQSGKPVLDSELNLSQAINQTLGTVLLDRTTPSGWVRGPSTFNPLNDFVFPTTADPEFVAESFYMRRRTALVAGMPIIVGHTNTPPVSVGEGNLITLDPAPVNGGAPPDVKRTDFVFLEAFKAQVEWSPHATGTITINSDPDTAAPDTVTIGAVTLSAAAAPAALSFVVVVGNTAATATNLAAAINDPANGLAAVATAQVDVTTPNQVNVRSVPGGTAGNATAFTYVEVVGGTFTFNPGGGFLAGGVDTPNKPTQDTIYWNGNVLSDPTYDWPDDIADPVIGVETTKRVQIQYRIRNTGQAEAVNFSTQCDGFSNPQVLAQATQAAPVNLYRLVPADGKTVLAFIQITNPLALVAGQTFTVNGTVFTAVAVVVNPTDFLIGGTAAATAANLEAVIAATFPATLSTGVSSNVITLTTATPAPGNDITITTTAPAIQATVAVNSAVAYGTVDNGLWVSGNGTIGSATDLGTVDGFSYAIPIGFVFRRNDASGTGGFNPSTNANGAISYNHGVFNNTNLPGAPAIPLGDSDRPDGLFYDVLVLNDILDLRKEVSPGGVDLMAETNRQMQALLDTESRTWAADGSNVGLLAAGSGTVGTRFLVCNEFGRIAGPASTYGSISEEFDHIRRRFADQSVVEKIAFAILPTDTAVAQPGKYVNKVGVTVNWYEDDVVVLDLTALNPTGLGDWDNATATLAGANVVNFWPTGTTITNVLRVIHDDGNYAAAVSKDVQIKNVTGLGTAVLEITLDANNTIVDGGTGGAPYRMVGDAVLGDIGSPRRIFFEVEISYPLAVGTTNTPVEVLTPDTTVATYANGPLIEENPAQRPADYQTILTPTFRQSHREVGLEYVANDAGGPPAPISDTVVSDNPTTLTMVRRIYGGLGAPTVTDAVVPGPVAVAGTTPYGSSIRRINLAAPLSGAGQTLTTVDYYAQDPIPNYGAGAANGYRIAVYYNTSAPPTLGSRNAPVTPTLPSSVTLVPLAMSRDLWTSNVSVGSPDVPFPYANPTEKIPVNANINPADYPGEWVFCATANISVGDFSAATGLLNVHTMVGADENTPITATGPDVDSDYRAHYKVADVASYQPVAMAQPLSGPFVHKVWLPFLAYATEDSVLWRKNEVLLVVITRYAKIDQNNTVAFTDSVSQTSCVGIYRTRGLLLLANQ